MFGILADDFTADGRTDLLMAGNFHGLPPRIGRMASSYGAVLRSPADGNFASVPSRQSGLTVRDQVRDIAVLRTAQQGRVIVFAKNDAPLQVVAPTAPNSPR
jgi:hypothetical protein